MKYYHIIYNSSEKPMEGGVGFGIRTVTEGTPKELINAINDINCFSDDWESYTDKPAPAKIKEDPAIIETIPKNYAVTSITDEHGKSYSVIARRAYVGFDYGFYKNGMPTRTGNYVIDYYVFDSTPDSSAYEILYEKALPGSNHFIPKSVRPTEDNEEMREISVGAQAALPVEDRPFKAAVDNMLDKDVVKLFFHYLNALQNGKKLVVKASREKALKLTADLYRMLDSESAKKMRVYINHRSQGINDNFDIFFIHEDYPHPVYPALYNFVEIDKVGMPATDEARAFGEDLEKFVTDSFEENKADVYDTLKWLMMPEYSTVKKLSKPTIDSFFLYCIQPGNFTYENLFPAGKPNDEFLRVLCDYSKKDRKNADLLKDIVAQRMNDVNPYDVVKAIKEYNHLIAMGFNLADVTEDVKRNVCTQLLSDINLFRNAIDTLGLKAIEKFFDKEVFENHNDYLNQSTLDTYMPELYKWFMTDAEQKDMHKFLYSHFLSRPISKDIFHRIIDNVYGRDEDNKIAFFIICLKDYQMNVSELWPYIKHYLDRSANIYDFLKVFADRHDDGEYAPLFHHSIVRKKKEYAKPENIGKVTEILTANPDLKHLVQKNYKSDGIYEELYRNLDVLADTDTRMAYDVLRDNVIDFGINDDKFKTLEIYIYLKKSKDYKYMEDCPKQKLRAVYDKVNEHQNKELFDGLLPYFVEMTRKNLISPEELALQFRKYYPSKEEISTYQMLKRLVPRKDWIDMIGAVVKEDKLRFKEAMALSKQFEMAPEQVDVFLTRCYEKDYKSYKRINKIKNAFSSIIKLFKGKKKEEAEVEKEGAKDNPDTKPSKKPSKSKKGKKDA